MTSSAPAADEANIDAWIDAYLVFRKAWVAGANEAELTVLAGELRQKLPEALPPEGAVREFIARDIAMTVATPGLAGNSPAIVSGLWLPSGT